MDIASTKYKDDFLCSKKDFDLDESMDLQFNHTYTDAGCNTYAHVRDIKDTCFKVLIVLVLHGTFSISFINHT